MVTLSRLPISLVLKMMQLFGAVGFKQKRWLMLKYDRSRYHSEWQEWAHLNNYNMGKDKVHGGWPFYPKGLPHSTLQDIQYPPFTREGEVGGVSLSLDDGDWKFHTAIVQKSHSLKKSFRGHDMVEKNENNKLLILQWLTCHFRWKRTLATYLRVGSRREMTQRGNK